MSEPDAFDRVTTRIGDLDHPFYDEERQRDVWNEASAVGFQFLLWAMLLTAAAAAWIGGPTALPLVVATTVPVGLAGILVVAYAARRGIDLSTTTAGVGRGRAALVVALLLALVTGLLHQVDVDVATLLGIAVGAALPLVVAVVVTRRGRRGTDDADRSPE